KEGKEGEVEDQETQVGEKSCAGPQKEEARCGEKERREESEAKGQGRSEARSRAGSGALLHPALLAADRRRLWERRRYGRRNIISRTRTDLRLWPVGSLPCKSEPTEPARCNRELVRLTGRGGTLIAPGGTSWTPVASPR